MTSPLISILIRNKYRPQLLIRCLDSINRQDYKNVKAFVISDSILAFEHCFDLLHSGIYCFKFKTWGIQPGSSANFWNLYCNELLEMVEENSWFFFMDNDDYLRDAKVLSELVPHLDDENKGVVVQFLRNGRIKPNGRLMDQRIIKQGLIGGGCIVLHSKFKDVAKWDDQPAGDYRFIKQVSEKVPLKFVKIVLQVAGNNGLHGA